MLIRTFHTDYVVISQVESDNIKDVYICKQYPVNNMTEYRVLCVKNPEAAERLVSFFTEQVNPHEFTDFVEFFPSGGNTYFIYINSLHQTLSNKLLKDECSFYERLEIAKSLLERMVFLNMPYVIQCDVLTTAHCTVAKNLSVFFNYTFVECKNFEHVGIQYVGVALKHVFSTLFRQEIDLNSCEDINQYIKYLTEGTYETYLDLLYAYHDVYSKMQQKTIEEVEKPNTFSFTLWEKTKSIFRVFKKVLLVLLLVLSICYLAYTIYESLQPSEAQEAIGPIGDYQFKEEPENEIHE